MKQETYWQMTKSVIKCLAIIFWNITKYLAIEIKFRIKWWYQDIEAILYGYKNHADRMQRRLEINQTIKHLMS